MDATTHLSGVTTQRALLHPHSLSVGMRGRRRAAIGAFLRSKTKISHYICFRNNIEDHWLNLCAFLIFLRPIVKAVVPKWQLYFF